ncbi:C2 domain family protein [Acanthocheilonema viteae]
MREILSNDDGYSERILPGTSSSKSTTPPLEPHGRSNSTISMPNAPLTPFISTGRHRLLPQTPAYHIRRSSSPRFLPTPPLPPPLTSGTVTAVSDFSLYKRSTTSGRRLPQIPIHKDSNRLIADQKTSTSIRQQYSTNANIDVDNNTNTTGNIGDNEWPSPTILQRKFSELQKISQTDSNSISKLFKNSSCGTSLRSLQRLSFLKQQHQQHHHYHHQQQQDEKLNHPQYSLDHSSGTSISTNVFSQSSSLSPSVEQLTHSNDVEEHETHGINSSLHEQGAATSCSSVPDIPRKSTVRTSSSWPENEPRPTGLGLIHCSLQHFPIRKRLRVSLLKAEGLAGKLKPELEIHAFCKITLLPSGKSQNSVVKRGRDVAFNQEFFFDNILVEDLSEKCLAIAVYHQSPQKLQKDVIIGDLYISLKNLSELRSKKEVKIVEELKHRINSKKLGKLYITSCLEKKASRLTINIIKVEDLPKGGITGSPDVCVRVCLTQNNVTQTKQSRVIKGTCNATYKEAIMFLVKTRSADLEDTSITVSVHDLSRTTAGDDLIGSAYLGKLAIDKSEHEQWKNTIEHIGKEFKVLLIRLHS